MHLPHCVTIFYNVPWFCSIKVSNKKLQCNAENACGNRMCERTFTGQYKFFSTNKLKFDAMWYIFIRKITNKAY